jgi:pyruvate dehydrogenase E1 component beta subunit
MARSRQASGREGIEAEVVGLRTLRPLDIDTVPPVTTVSLRWRRLAICSISSRSAAWLEAFDDLDAPPTKISSAGVPMPTPPNWRSLLSVEGGRGGESVCYRE